MSEASGEHAAHGAKAISLLRRLRCGPNSLSMVPWDLVQEVDALLAEVGTTGEPDLTLRRIYPCWCDGQDGCDGTTFEPFGLCPECTKYHHGTAPRMGLTAEDLEAMVYG